ncbi:MAG TPA: CDP-diacylglycerol--serine O-phosphatidyltransferase [Clostridiales bacterium]|uniref:CDP-alcohol phosphatidyltransferase family protein n=1 Tax=Candidatus Egerieisoma faecipullorum TaxID=2840963 RepID=A0A9D1I6A2_9CLOT|nr:CDP-diacylglycerol--serine O-phosphatidyltransferase [Clostridiales bacterium]HIU28814.1 CDP-alcohol phosphatidyltransferase family protein [Candidatus Egerieisoma faecipullorum]
MIGYYNVSVILTYIGLLSSLFGMANLSVARSNPWAIKIAFLCLLFSGLCDMFDGKIARRTNRSPEAKEFGIQIDSLCDLICFGVYPAFIVTTISSKHWISMIAGALFVLGGVIRLAYFNVVENERQHQTSENRKYYQGLPITSSALIFPFIYAVEGLVNRYKPKIPIQIPSMNLIYTIIMFLVAFLFVWDIKVKKPGLKETVVMGILGLLIVVGILIR